MIASTLGPPLRADVVACPVSGELQIRASRGTRKCQFGRQASLDTQLGDIVQSLMISIDLQKNLDLFRDCLSGPLVQRLALDKSLPAQKRRSKGQRKKVKEVANVPEEDDDARPAAEELTDFVDV